MVVAGIHGDERACLPMAHAFRSASRPLSMRLSIIPLANPDGWQANARRNARGVDLNRNFPWLWNPDNLAGPAAGSEAETQALMNLILGERPDLVVWVHQPLGYIAAIGDTPAALAAAWAGQVDGNVRDGIRHLGGSETWTALVAGVPSLLVEADGWEVDPVQIAAHERGLEAAIGALGV